jgi:hypothetical protein
LESETGKRFALVGSSILVGFLLLELAVRLVEPREVIREFFERPDPVLHHKFLPGARGRHKTPEFDAAYVINSLGLRDREISRDKPAGMSRILMLGDSFTEGNGVDQKETFSSRLQAMLNQAGFGKRWQVINAGVGSYSPLLEYVYLKNGGLDLQPDLVILNFDLSDFYDDIQYTQLAEFDAKGDPVAVRADPEREKGSWAGEILVGFKDFLKRHARTYNFVRRRIGGYVEAARHKQNFSGDIRFDKYAMLREAGEPQGDRAWTLSYKYLIKIRDLLKARGIDFWVTVYPYGLQVSPREWAGGRRFWGFETGKVYSTRPQGLVEHFCRENDIPVINMCDDFKELSRTVYPLYYENDGHWLPAGHQFVATLLYRALVPYLQARETQPATVSQGAGLSRSRS